MGSLHEIECLLDIEIGDRKLNPGKKKPNKNRYYYYSDRYYIIELTQDKWMICSDNRETRVLLRNHCWCINKGYGKTTDGGTSIISYHKVYLNYDDDLVADHINRHKFDNRFENLRIVTPQENSRNHSTRTDNTSGKQGVQQFCSRGEMYWIARIAVGGGKRVCRLFSINKYGNDEAYRRAVQSRIDLEQQYNYIGE